jgi:hypothetical protein
LMFVHAKILVFYALKPSRKYGVRTVIAFSCDRIFIQQLSKGVRLMRKY